MSDVIIEASGCTWLVTLRDHDTGQQFTVGVAALQGLWAALEAVLISGAIPWRGFTSYKRLNAAGVPQKRR